MIICNILVVPEFCFIMFLCSCSVAMFAMIKETQAKKLVSEVFGQFLACIHNIYCLYNKDLQQQLKCGNCIMNLDDGI